MSTNGKNGKNGNGKKYEGKIRYAVVGLGHIAQIAVLPAFEHAKETSELTALVSDDKEKLAKMSKQYGVKNLCSYDDYDELLKSGDIDAVYIALPNDMHKDFTVRAAKQGIHILCEKPMATTVEDCKAMIAAAEENDVRLMIAYRLHFEKTNMTVAQLVQDGAIGDPRLFNSSFTLQVRDGNIRTKAERGGGPLFDIGIYCINAARYIFKDEPTEVQAFMTQSDDPRFNEIEEAAGVMMRFPGHRLASFVCSFGAEAVGNYQVVGTEGDIKVDPAYEYVDELKYTLTKKGKKSEEVKTPKSDQFAPELNHFSECIAEGKEPRPSGYEGLADLKIIEALNVSAETGYCVALEKKEGETSKPDASLIERKPAVDKPKLVNVKSGSRD
ncbi:MAG: Gfo/Idh/MocA family oxidoreductase [Candidatus Melainabacteria bacterium]|mgnify:CR=1 FL=1|nr:Gfo/Idh/MocA family oxidoreductase [Candidatus Melainabacteria bacterium]